MIMIIKIMTAIFTTILMHFLLSAVPPIMIAEIITIMKTTFTTVLMHSLLSAVPLKSKSTNYGNAYRSSQYLLL